MDGRILTEIGKKLGIDRSLFARIRQFRIDSRQIEPGDFFFALEGERSDGHDFLEDVAKRGALGAVVSKGYRGEAFGLPLFYVEDQVETLQVMARESLEQKNCQIVGITGSVGKTTTKEFLATLLEGAFRVGKSPFSYNSQRTFPLSILNRQGDEEVLILEMAMSEPGHILKLVQIAPPDIAVITKIGRSHTEFFPNGIEGVAAAKGEILHHPQTSIGVIDAAAMQYVGISNVGSCTKKTFGRDQADLVLVESAQGLQLVESGEKSAFFVLPFTARHLCDNFLAAASVARALGLTFEEIIRNAALLKPVSKRFEVLDLDGVTYVNDSYNASAESTTAALQNLPTPKPGGKRVFVFGEMRELGKLSDVSHAEVGKVASQHVDHLVCLGDLCKPTVEAFAQTKRPVEICASFEELKEVLGRVIASGDVVLIKGANSHKLWRLVERV